MSKRTEKLGVENQPVERATDTQNNQQEQAFPAVGHKRWENRNPQAKDVKAARTNTHQPPSTEIIMVILSTASRFRALAT
jgi:hypothetical protein